LPQDRIEELTEAILDITEIIPVTGELENIITDPKDNPIIETALLAKADFLVTGDKHILALRKYRNVQIITVGQFLKKL
jgi:putative PIN family toxin of toxin-antitoxin system